MPAVNPQLLRTFALRFAPLFAVIAAATLGAAHHDQLLNRLSAHGWERGLSIDAKATRPHPDTGSKPSDAFAIMKTDPHAWAVLLSAPALAQIRSMPAVESVHRLNRAPRKVDQDNRKVQIFYVAPEFISAFKLGDPAALSDRLSVSGTPRRAQAIRPLYPDGLLLLRDEPLSTGVSAEVRDSASARPPAERRLGDHVFSSMPWPNPEAMEFFASIDSLESPLPPPSASSGPLTPGVTVASSGSFSLPTVIVKLRPGFDLHAAMNEIQAAIDANPAAFVFKGMGAEVEPLIDGYDHDKTRRALFKSATWIPAALAAALALIALILVWLRFRALNLELALRRSFGQPKWQAALQTLRPELISLAIATAAACLIAWAWFAVQGYPWAAPKLWPAAWGGAAIGAALALLLARAVLRKPTALLLKAQVG